MDPDLVDELLCEYDRLSLGEIGEVQVHDSENPNRGESKNMICASLANYLQRERLRLFTFRGRYRNYGC